MGGFSKAPMPPMTASGGNSDADLPTGADFSTPATAPKPTPSPRASFLGELSGSGFDLSAPVGSGAANRPDDVFKLESVLDGAGLLGRKPGKTFGNDTAKAITTGQQAFNSSHAKRLGLTTLKEDGLVTPGGPTQSATRKLAGSLIVDDKEVANILKMRQAEEAKSKAEAQRSKMVKAAVENARRIPRSLLDRTPRPTPKAAAPRPVRSVRTTQPRPTPQAPGVPWWRQGRLKPLDAAGDASNQRTADHLRTIHGVGDIPRWTSDALETAGDKGVADVADLLEKVHKNNPAQARQLADETFQRLSESTQKRLRAMEKAPQSVETETKFSAEHTAAKEVKSEAARLNEPVPPIPADKTEWFKGKEKEWREFHKAAGKLPGITPNERAVYMHIFGREGGMVKDKEGSAASGIRQKTADLYLGKGDLSHVKPGTPPDMLSALDRTRIYRRYMDDQFPKIGGHTVLDQVGDTKGATALADGMFRLGSRDATNSIQEAMKRIDPSVPTPDKAFGSKSLRDYKRLLSDPKTRDSLLNAIADEFSKTVPGEKNRWDKLRP
jgi:hypothetical protein